MSAAPDGRLRLVSVPGPWSAAIVPVSVFPVPEAERSRLRLALQTWCASCAARLQLTSSTWLQMNQFHLDDGARKMSANGRAWLPVTGLGVWPDRDPPRLWTANDFQ